jgi:hypothetical protein
LPGGRAYARPVFAPHFACRFCEEAQIAGRFYGRKLLISVNSMMLKILNFLFVFLSGFF